MRNISLLLLFTTAAIITGEENIAFISERDGNEEIYFLDFESNSLTNLTNSTGNDCQLIFSPDGTLIAFRSDRDGVNNLYTMNI